LPDELVAYRRVTTDAGAPSSAHVYLNFSSREVPLRAPQLAGSKLFSNLHGARSTFDGVHKLAPYEGVVVF
jgi:hypothetical protein